MKNNLSKNNCLRGVILILLVRESIFVRWGSPFPIVLVPRYKLSLCPTPIKPNLLGFSGIGVFAYGLRDHVIMRSASVMLHSVKLNDRKFYSKVWIWPCLDRIISSLFKMIRPRITNRFNGKFLRLLLKPLEFFSCMHLLATTLYERSSR